MFFLSGRVKYTQQSSNLPLPCSIIVPSSKLIISICFSSDLYVLYHISYVICLGFTISEFISTISHEIIFTNSERGVRMQFKNDTDLYRVIGSNIKYYREQAKLTQVQLAEQAKISISYLSKIEAAGCDKSLSISVLNQIANVLGVEIMEFFKEEKNYG